MTRARSELARARVAAGLTQEALAEVLRVHPDTVRRWERGSAQPTPPTRPHVAGALGISRDELDQALHTTTPPSAGNLSSLADEVDVHGDDEAMESLGRRKFLGLAGAAATSAAIGLGARRTDPDVTSALLLRNWFTSTAGDRPARTKGELAPVVALVKTDYQACRYTAAGERLPALLDELEHAVTQADDDDERRALEVLASHAYHVAASLQIKAGQHGPALMAADASLRNAQHSEDPIALAASSRILTHSLMAAKRHRDAETVTRRSAEQLARSWGAPDDDAVSVYGSLLLRGAIAAAEDANPSACQELLEEADDAARRLGHDGNHQWTAFGPTNVLQHRVTAAVLLGNAGTAVQISERIDRDAIDVRERKASLFLDLAQAFVQWRKLDQAYEALCAAEALAPQELTGRPSSQAIVLDAYRNAPSSMRRDLRELAHRVGAA